MSGECSARLEAVGVSVTRTPPTVRSMTLTDVARSADLATTGCPRSARIRKTRADMAHAHTGRSVASGSLVWERRGGPHGRRRGGGGFAPVLMREPVALAVADPPAA